MVILQNAEELLKHKRMVDAIDAVAKEGLFHTWNKGARMNDSNTIKWSVDNLNIAKNAGRPVFVVDYAKSRAAAETSVKRINELGYIPYVGPRELNTLWLPGKNF